MTDVVWLASYPRSGNTWLRFMLSGYLFGLSETSVEVNRKIADIHRKPSIDWNNDRTVFLKTHFQLRPGHPKYEQTAAFIFILRNPRDVLLSNFAYLRMVGEIGDMPFEEFARDFIANRGAEHWRISAGDWFTHARYWLGQRDYPGIFVRYEDLRQRPLDTMARIVSFLGETPSTERLNQTVEAGQLSNMRALEEREKRADAPTIFSGQPGELGRGVRFINSGETRRTLGSDDPELEAAFDRSFAPALEQIESLARGLPESWQRRFPIVPALD